MGLIVGPVIGGALVNPAEKYASLDVEFFREYPYALPNIVVGLSSLLILVVALFFLPESRIPSSHVGSLTLLVIDL